MFAGFHPDAYWTVVEKKEEDGGDRTSTVPSVKDKLGDELPTHCESDGAEEESEEEDEVFRFASTGDEGDVELGGKNLMPPFTHDNKVE